MDNGGSAAEPPDALPAATHHGFRHTGSAERAESTGYHRGMVEHEKVF